MVAERKLPPGYIGPFCPKLYLQFSAPSEFPLIESTFIKLRISERDNTLKFLYFCSYFHFSPQMTPVLPVLVETLFLLLLAMKFIFSHLPRYSVNS